MTFKLDTSGEIIVAVRPFTSWAGRRCTWSDLTPFAQGYIEAALTGFSDLLTQGLGEPLCVGFSDLASETLAKIIEDCERYENAVMAAYSDEKRHKAGTHFFQRRQQPAGWMTFPPQTLTLCDDGKVRFSDASTSDASGVA